MVTTPPRNTAGKTPAEIIAAYKKAGWTDESPEDGSSVILTKPVGRGHKSPAEIGKQGKSPSEIIAAFEEVGWIDKSPEDGSAVVLAKPIGGASR